MRAFFALAVLGLLLATPARAGQQCVSNDVSPAWTDWNQSLQLSRFDPSLGTLNSVTVTMTSTMSGSAAAESLDSSPATVTSTLAAWAYLNRPNGTQLMFVLPSVTFVDDLSGFDGTIDFAGASGVTHTGVSTTAASTIVLSGDLSPFVGGFGNPGSVNLLIGAIGASTVSGTTHPQFFALVGVVVDVCYDYAPAPALPFCVGDGSVTACPCGNTSAPGAFEGCSNSTGVGAHLDATGTSSLSNDTLVLSCSGLPATTATLFFQGTFAPGGGSAFGDGVRCVAGVTTRLRIKIASGGVATYPEPGDAPISLTGSVPANTVRLYQAWYRNAAPFCTAATFNLSQALSVSWTP